MWINWKQPRLLSLAADTIGTRLVKILPGVQFVADSDWNFIRPSIADKIDRGEMEVIGEKIETGRVGEKGKTLPDIYVGTEFKDFDTKKQDELIRGCLSVECLNILKEKSPESVRIQIANQIDKMTKRPEGKKK